MYESDVVNTTLATNDLCKFRIAVINNDKGDGTATYIHFRAFIDAFSDNYNADWGSVKYVGRAEELYTYEGFNREVSLDLDEIIVQVPHPYRWLSFKHDGEFTTLRPTQLFSLPIGSDGTTYGTKPDINSFQTHELNIYNIT